jgi:hypothetical protein
MRHRHTGPILRGTCTAALDVSSKINLCCAFRTSGYAQRPQAKQLASEAVHTSGCFRTSGYADTGKPELIGSPVQFRCMHLKTQHLRRTGTPERATQPEATAWRA